MRVAWSSIFFWGIFSVAGCAPQSDTVRSAVETAQRALSRRDCAEAYETIAPIYNSTASNNAVRLAMATTYACMAGVNLFELLSDLAVFGVSLEGSGLWQFLTQEFPSTRIPNDAKPTAALHSIQALWGMLNPGTVVQPTALVQSDSFNPGSLNSMDRLKDANLLLVFSSMALLGTLGNQYGSPNHYHQRTVDLPWGTPSSIPGDACAFGAALMNFVDGLEAAANLLPAPYGTTFESVQSFVGGATDAACAYGCSISCGGAVSCDACPMNLRDPSRCTGLMTDLNTCAVLGVVNFANRSWQMGNP